MIEIPETIEKAKVYDEGSAIYDYKIQYSNRPEGWGKLLIERASDCLDLRQVIDEKLDSQDLIGDILSFYPNGDNRKNPQLRFYWGQGFGSKGACREE